MAEILAEMRSTPKGVRFADGCKVASHDFGAPRRNGTSHNVWKSPRPGDPRINLQAGESGEAKPYQVRQAVAAIDTLLVRQGASGSDVEPSVEVEPPKPLKPKKRRR